MKQLLFFLLLMGLFPGEQGQAPAPAQLRECDSREHTISVPWKLGGPGTQTITAVAPEQDHQTITLKREGFSEGFYDNDARKKGWIKIPSPGYLC
ncbi:hypothetical protein SAMN04488128_102102 [Chitinophaga eiseniae]|uniref:Uncharacterized protein n=1 Tax=Chitinophaga eiseniae TaxID=634771 RepID=A0A1T4Q0H2_9BACT|nr:hypothetical protein [Chitinophaga eiseniae]SJZ97229.1 hypothetical protein SAMN04488128_102102 [Chitinophaga eiseniae]